MQEKEKEDAEDNKDKDEPPPFDCSDDRNKRRKDRKSEKKRKSNSNSNSRRLLRRRRHNNNHDNDNEYEQKKSDNDNNIEDKNDRRIKRYLQRFHKGITDTDNTAADIDDEINYNNNNNARRPKNNKQKKINMILMLKDCLQKLLVTGAGLLELSSCLFLASSSGNHDAVTLILEQITKWNNNVNNTKKKQKHTKNKKHQKHRNNNKYNTIDIDDLINGTNNNSSDGNNSSMLTPLHIACLLHNGGMASILIQYGANKYARDANGETPVDDLGLTELIMQYENSLLRTEANERANQRDHFQQQELQKEQTLRDMEWSNKLADVNAQDQMQYGTAEQKFGKGWDDTTTNDVLNEAGGHSDGDWWSRIAQERKQKKQKQAASAFAAFAASGNSKRSRSNISGDDGGNDNGGGKSTNTNNESSSDNNKKKDTTAGTTTGPTTEIIIIDPREARAIDNRAWSAFMEKWSTVAPAAAAVVVSTNKTTTTLKTTTEGGAATSSPSSSSSLLLGTETKDDDPIIMQQSNRRTMMIMTDVPWPCMGDATPFPGGSQQSSSSVVLLTPGERKVYHRQLLRRWHPDKFLQRFHSHLVQNEKEGEEKEDDDNDNRMATRILKRVTAVFQSINNNNNDNTY